MRSVERGYIFIVMENETQCILTCKAHKVYLLQVVEDQFDESEKVIEEGPVQQEEPSPTVTSTFEQNLSSRKLSSMEANGRCKFGIDD